MINVIDFTIRTLAALMHVKIQKRKKNVSKNPLKWLVSQMAKHSVCARPVIDSLDLLATDSATVSHHHFLIFHFRFLIWQRQKHQQTFNRVSKLYRRFMTTAMNGVQTRAQSRRDDVVVSASVVHSRCKKMTIGRQRS